MTVLVSPDFEVVIPVDIRRALGIQPGQEVKVIQYDNRVELIPVRPIETSRGMLNGIETDVQREADRV